MLPTVYILFNIVANCDLAIANPLEMLFLRLIRGDENNRLWSVLSQLVIYTDNLTNAMDKKEANSGGGDTPTVRVQYPKRETVDAPLTNPYVGKAGYVLTCDAPNAIISLFY